MFSFLSSSASISALILSLQSLSVALHGSSDLNLTQSHLPSLPTQERAKAEGFRRERAVRTVPSGFDHLRPLVWGDVNILHSTDIHGWYQGHRAASPPEPNYSSDWADWVAFGEHMRRKANEKGVDLLLIDTGDLHDGNGLSDGFPLGEHHSVPGHLSNKVFQFAHYQLGTIGNHELYEFELAKSIHTDFAPRWNGRYLTSNVNITLSDERGKSVSRPIGARYVRFKTPTQGVQVTSFGIMFDFRAAARGITVQDPREMVKEQWFLDVLQEDAPVDLFVLPGHMPVSGEDPGWDAVHSTIRRFHPTTPIAILGGHTHVRDCRMLDPASMALESGRYLETIGWMSIAGLKNETEGVRFSRRYLDANPRNMAFHANLANVSDLHTADERLTRHVMDQIADSWNLTQLHGHVPRDFYLDRFPYSHHSSLLTLLSEEVLPHVVRKADFERAGHQSVILINSGSQRFDVYAGLFTRNDRYIVSPFRDHFLSIRDVPWSIAKRLLAGLNDGPASTSTEDPTMRYDRGFIDNIFERWQAAQRSWFKLQPWSATLKPTMGYVTQDSCEGEGDDTLHVPVPYNADQPAFVASYPSPLPQDEDAKVDVVFVEFILKSVVRLLNQYTQECIQNLTASCPEPWFESHLRTYMLDEAVQWGDVGLTTQTLYPRYAELMWNKLPPTRSLKR